MLTREVDAPMTVGSPAVARYRLRMALREAREAKGLTQRQVADSLDWSLSKVNRIEGGEVSIATTDLRALLGLYEITDPDRVRDLVETGRAARQRSSWDRAYGEHLSQTMVDTFQFEAEATEIRSFQPTLVPGLLQTQAYASAVMDRWRDELSETERAARIDARIRRRELLFDRPDPPLYLLALDESVLMRTVGGPRVTSDQLYELLRLVRADQVMIRVVPFSHLSGFAALWNLFTIYTIGHEDVLMYRENYSIEENVYESANINLHRKRFDQIWEHSMSPESSTNLIEARAAGLRSEADRRDQQ